MFTPSRKQNSAKTLRASSVNDFTHLYHAESSIPAALIVYQNANPASSEPEIVQLMYKAKSVIPAVRNYLFFNACRVAVVYFGKRVNESVKIGIKDGAGDFKVKMIRFLTSEIWPPLLRTDAPDESLGTELVDKIPDKCSGLDGEDVSRLATARQEAEALQEKEWVKKSLETSMEVLVYLKKAEQDTKYLKVILHNSTRRIHFDITDPRDEKFRWEGRKLFTRIMDNLESQKAVDSYESYSTYFREACEMAALHSDELEQPTQPLLKAIIWTTEAPPTSLFHSCVSFSSIESSKKITKMGGSLASNGGEKHEHAGRKREVLLKPLSIPSVYDEARVAVTPTSTPIPPVHSSASPLLPMESHDNEEPSGAVKTSFSVEGRGRYTDPGSWVGSLHPDEIPPSLSYLPSPLLRSRHVSRRLSTLGSAPQYIMYELSPERYYTWMASLEKPESATLDYKSYMSHPANEIIQRSVKFICGFLNAYREGKLVIGIHEIPRRPSGDSSSNSGTTEMRKDGRHQLILHNDLVDQFVVGVKMSEDELEEVQSAVSEQLLNCVPPIPPVVVQVELVPIRFPDNVVFSDRILVLYDLSGAGISTQDAIKQKCNAAIRFLFPLGLSIVPMEVTDIECDQMLLAVAGVDSNCCDSLTVEVFHITAINSAVALENKEWEPKLLHALGPSGKRCNYFLTDSPRVVYEPSEVHVVEISVDMKRCPYAPLRQYKGKFFSGWPSIPIWDEITERVRSYPRNYHIWEAEFASFNGSFASASRLEGSLGMAQSLENTAEQTLSPLAERSLRTSREQSHFSSHLHHHPARITTCTNTPPVVSFQHLPLAKEHRTEHKDGFPPGKEQKSDTDSTASFQWFKQMHLVQRILRFLFYSTHAESMSTFRLIHPLWNSVFENFLGKDVVRMIFRTPVGNPMLPMEWKKISRLQSSLQLSALPPLPLLLCRVYELLGNFPSPFPYVSVPLQQQTFRLSPHLIPLFYYQSYFDGIMRMSVVLDIRDSFLKLVQLRCGVLTLNCIAGVGFEPMSNYKLISQVRNRQLAKQTRSYAHLTKDLLVGSRRTTSPISPLSFAQVHTGPFFPKPAVAETPRPLMGGSKRLLAAEDHFTEVGSLMSSHGRDLCVTATREVERNIPLLSFQFIAWNEFQGTDRACVVDNTSFSGSLMAPSCRPWTLLTLLNWFRSVLMDPKHVNNFGYCNRSFAFTFLRIEDICCSHFQTSILARLKSDGITFSSEENCLLHRRQEKWRELPGHHNAW